MLRLVYVSSATVPFDDADLEALLEVSRANNARNGITGVLLYHQGSFLQVLEGEPAAVRALHARIRRDPRHHGVLDVLEEHDDERTCPDWAMGYVPTRRRTDREVAGFTALLLPPGDVRRRSAMHGSVRAALDTFLQSVR